MSAFYAAEIAKSLLMNMTIKLFFMWKAGVFLMKWEIIAISIYKILAKLDGIQDTCTAFTGKRRAVREMFDNNYMLVLGPVVQN